MNDLNTVIEKAKRIDWSDINGAITKAKKRNHDSIILDFCFEILRSTETSQTTGFLLTYLKLNHKEIPREKLLALLNRNKDRFKRLVNGYWALKETNASNNISGSLRDIIREKLQNNTEPLHVSELLNFVNKFHKTNEKSLVTNLKMDGTFKMFNCSYIGLSSIKYDQYWLDLPVFRPPHLNKSTLEINKLDDPQKIADFLFSEYGYPKKHILHLLSLRR